MYDFIIVGGGCSGLSAAMYGTRLGLKTLTFAKMPGGLITTTHLVENWPGEKGISGPDLAMKLYDHAIDSGAEIKAEEVVSIENLSDGDSVCSTKFKVVSANGSEYEAKSVLIATGTEHRRLGIPGEKELENKGVSFCALCDGAFFKEKIVFIVGGGDSAAKEALFLTEHAARVVMLVRKTLRAEPINVRKVENNKKIEVLYNTELVEIIGKDKVEKVKLSTGEEMDADGVFLAIGHNPQTKLAESLGVEMNSHKEIKINRNSETSVAGVFAAGDCCDTVFKQAITGSAEGVTAAYNAYHLCDSEHSF